jgi:nucleotide-binding universal stress UspA family protein
MAVAAQEGESPDLATAPLWSLLRCAQAEHPGRFVLIDSDGSGPRTTPVVLTSASPAFAIIDYAGGHDIDLIVMGTHGRGGLAHMLMGSAAEKVVRLAPCPVLTVRHPEHEFVRPDTLTVVAHA